MTEGTIQGLLEGLREEITATAVGKLGGLLIRPAARRLRKRLDPDTYGGAYLLGLRGLAVIAHGNSSRRAITNADQPGRPRRREGRRRQADSESGRERVSISPLNDPDPQREVTWQRRAMKSTSESRKF